MKFLIALTAFVAVAAANLFDRPPISTIEELEVEQDPRIISGKPAIPGQFPWQVVNRFKVGSGTSFCGGALICDSWVLTAAHCAQGASQFTISLGSVNQSQAVEPGRVVVESTQGYVHPSYSSWTLNNDIALIRLPQKVNFTSRIQPIVLGRDYTAVNVSLTVSGWGKTSDASNTVSPILNYVDLNTISNAECQTIYGASVINSTLCCRGRPQHSTCNGDSGGPLIQKVNGNPIHVGVVSFVHRAGCASGNPSGYVRTANYRDWILKTINGTCTLPQ